ncbi:hypothetical protein PR048_014055 [Dryococelus australis]|uniref:Rho-GAP domain-containing protein n=1 Tax=Dryococelus australis TaxID=614101 RepID=A0ABQ9HTW5_9NEOP|nr:hypothetical protein PR048_014055 [Dryococelus australis]
MQYGGGVQSSTEHRTREWLCSAIFMRIELLGCVDVVSAEWWSWEGSGALILPGLLDLAWSLKSSSTALGINFRYPSRSISQQYRDDLHQVAAPDAHALAATSWCHDGIYRVSGVKSRVEKLCQAFENGADLVDLSDMHPNVVASVLKLYLRQLPEPLLTFRLYPEFDQSEPGSIPGRFTPDFCKFESCQTIPLIGGFTRGSPVPPPFHSSTVPYSPHFTLIVSQDIDVKSRPNLFTHFTNSFLECEAIHQGIATMCAHVEKGGKCAPFSYMR